MLKINWRGNFVDILFPALGPIQGHKVQHLSEPSARLKIFFVVQP